MAEAVFLICTVGDERFLFDIGSVRQVLHSVEVTLVPGSPSFLEGIVLLGTEAVPVVDLRDRLFPTSPKPQYPLVVVVSTAIGLLGVKVDDVRRTVTLDLDALMPPPPLVSGLAGDLFVGVAEIAGRPHLIADLERILTTEEKGELKIGSGSEPMTEG
jgi:purine-binding chemotaxis protein CheW